MKPYAPAICLLIASLNSHATESEEPYFQPRFAAYEPSYAVYRKADNDENAITALFVSPLYIRVHRGPLRALSDYTRPQNAIGIGLKFSN
jgi:hypothetical protein